jgi:hypothetical protein
LRFVQHKLEVAASLFLVIRGQIGRTRVNYEKMIPKLKRERRESRRFLSSDNQVLSNVFVARCLDSWPQVLEDEWDCCGHVAFMLHMHTSQRQRCEADDAKSKRLDEILTLRTQVDLGRGQKYGHPSFPYFESLIPAMATSNREAMRISSSRLSSSGDQRAG